MTLQQGADEAFAKEPCPMRIVHILSSFHLGGAEHVALELAARQLAAGCEVSVYSIGVGPEGELAAAFRRRNIFVESVPKIETGFDPSLPFRLAWRLRNRRPDIIHTHNPHAMIYGAPAGRLLRAGVVHTKHGRHPDTVRRMVLRRAVAHLVDAYVAVSPLTASYAREQREVDERKLKTIDNGIDILSFHPEKQERSEVRSELGLPLAAFVVGTVGRLHPEKNQGLLIRAMAPLVSDSLRLILVGGGSELSSLQDLVAKLGVTSYVHFAGVRSDVARVLTAFDVFALSSSTEGLPLVILEAMATALPIVSTSVGGIPSVIKDATTGLLVPADDEAGLRQRLELLCKQPELAKTYGKQAYKDVCEGYSAEHMANQYLDLYRTVQRMRVV